MPAAIVASNYKLGTDNQSMEGKGLKSLEVAYAATIALVPLAAYEQHICVGQLTGNATINATLTNLKQFDKLVFYFEGDAVASTKVVTFGTGFLSSGTVSVPQSKGATVVGIYDGTAIRIVSREIYA